MVKAISLPNKKWAAFQFINNGFLKKKKKILLLCCLILLLSTPLICCCRAFNFNVMDFGAVGDGITNDTDAFVKAWNMTCNGSNSTAAVDLKVPAGNRTFLLYPVTFTGPCLPQLIHLSILGTIVAPTNTSAWDGKNQGRWLIFQGVSGLQIDGYGKIDGRGDEWWKILCPGPKLVPGCVKLAPTALSIISSQYISINKITIVNSPQTHILVTGSQSIQFESLTIRSPETSRNTDGMHISNSKNVTIRKVTIGTGDDCISIGDHISNIDISDVTCGPGHGISIGSLGKSGNVVNVDNIKVSRVHFIRTTNGARIKTWQVGRGYVRGVVFEDLMFTDVMNPIIIDQYYCDVRGGCNQTETGVAINDVVYARAFGTSKSKVAINLNCSQVVLCNNILLDSILLESSVIGKEVISSCNNAYGTAKGQVKPNSCLAIQDSSSY
ncbi:probable polygalacturonase At1g80170 [Impatiens glandulifera]|uniref:probable polygalacturonase At1g80170 n=1 Tax=Impatiens glandulifera TaxID=253017 RepID=UPI001FB0D565|nr:probable polygalacturonase At1g80170 [Impatiens glandulifera]